MKETKYYDEEGKELYGRKHWEQHLKFLESKGMVLHSYRPEGYQFDLYKNGEPISAKEERKINTGIFKKMQKIFGYRPWMKSYFTESGDPVEVIDPDEINIRPRLRITDDKQEDNRRIRID